MHIVICGGGVIGASIAYFLTRRRAAVTIVERTRVAAAASGKSGGFLALDWCDGTPLQELARRSFALHAELAETIASDWGYRRLTTYGGLVHSRRGAGRRSTPGGWLDERVAIHQKLGSPDTTAQVHPQEFTEALIEQAEAQGAALRIGRVTGLAGAPGDGRIAGVVVDGETIAADAVVIALGPWSILAAAWMKLPPVHGAKGHSLIFAADAPAEALFLECEDETGALLSPEIYPRPDGTVWTCAISSGSPLPVDPATVAPDPGAMERLERLFRGISPALAEAPILARQACFRPVTQDGLPLIGPVPDMRGVYVATGHSVWGILNAPATGEAMAELILDGATSNVSTGAFDPARLDALDASELRLSG
jgi:glycine/D-amino acid oxidase-like deaminating enzyme